MKCWIKSRKTCFIKKSLTCAFSLILFGLYSQKTPVNIIFETDFNYDFDDVGALAMLHALEARGECKIIAVVVNAPNEYVAPSIDAMNTFYGRPDIPVGETKVNYHIDTWEWYNKFIHENSAFPHDLLPGKVPSALSVYKSVLAEAPDKSVKVVSVGFANNLKTVLEDPETRDLIKRKVKELVVMGGGAPVLPGGKTGNIDGFNMGRDLDGAEYFVDHWPTPIMWSSIGKKIKTGNRLISECPSNHIARVIFERWKKVTDKGTYDQIGYNRQSWDEVCVLYAVRGLGANFKVESSRGKWDITKHDTEKASVQYDSEKDEDHGYIVKIGTDSDIAKEIEDLMIYQPGF